MLLAAVALLAGSALLAQTDTGPSPKDAQVWLSRAQAYAKQNDQKAALAAAARAEELGGEDPRTLQGLANFYASSVPDFPKAAALGARYAERSPQDATAWHRLAAFCLSTGQPDQAIAVATRARAVHDSAELHSLLGVAYSQMKDWAKAVPELKEALAHSRYDEDAHFRLAQAFLFQQDFPSAVATLEIARKTFDRSPQIELALGVAYYGLRRFSDAVDQFLKTIRLAPDVPQPYVFLGRILDHADDRLPEVTERFAQFETANPASHLGYLLHAKAVTAQLPPTGFPAEAQTALELARKAVALKDDEAEAHYQLGLLLDRKQSYAEAATHLERSAKLNPRDSSVHYRLARVYDRLGRKEEAAAERAIHEKLNEQEGAPTIALDPPGPPASGGKK